MIGMSTRILGLDIGDKRIGVALSDPMGILASPLTIIQRQDDATAIRLITGLITRHDVVRVIAGLPRSMDGSIGKQAEKVQVFVHKLAGHTKVPIEFRDERLTTVSAQRLMKEAGTKKARGRKAAIKKADDAMAAALILQGYLEEAGLEN